MNLYTYCQLLAECKPKFYRKHENWVRRMEWIRTLSFKQRTILFDGLWLLGEYNEDPFVDESNCDD